MEADEDALALRVQTLSDLELAVLICLVAEQHCIIEAEEGSTKDVAAELKLVSRARVRRTTKLLMVVDCRWCFWFDVGGAGLHRTYHA